MREGVSFLDHRHQRKQPDWTYAAAASGRTPVEIRTRRVG